MKIKKQWILVLCLLVTINFFALITNAEESTVWKERKTIKFGNESKTLDIIWVNLNNDKVRLETSLANNSVCQVDTLSNLVNQVTDTDGIGIAGINGTFFNAYDDLQAAGTLIQNGEVKHVSNVGSVAGFTGNNEFIVDPLYIGIEGSVNNQWTWPNNWYAWNINHFFNDDNAVMLFDSKYYGIKPEHNFTGIVVNKGVVEKIEQGTFEIPTEGFLILSKLEDIIEKFNIGDSADYRFNNFKNDYNTVGHSDVELDWTNVRTGIGAGPTLVKDGIVVVDPKKEGFKEEKILSQRAQRSMIGINANNILAMVSVSNVSMFELAEIAQSIGLVDAINLDGGASSGTYINNHYLIEPSRKISNALIVKTLYEDPIKVELNGEELFFDSDPYLNREYNRTLVPLRTILEALGAVVTWDSETSSIVASRYRTEIKLKVDSNIVEVNGINNEMELPVLIRNDRSYVPARFITEYFGGQVGWIGETKTVVLTIETLEQYFEEARTYESKGQYELAISAFEKALNFDESHLASLKSIASIYFAKLSDYSKAADYYDKILDIEPDNVSVWSSYAWATYSAGDYDSAEKAFNTLIKIAPDNATGYYGIGLINASWSVNNVEKAKQYFELTLKKNPSKAQREYIEDYLSSH